MNRSVRVVAALALFGASPDLQRPVAQESAAQLTTAKRGLVGTVEFDYSGAPLVARPQPDLNAPMLLRLEQTRSTHYVARFLGSVEGDYDLRDWICSENGGSVPDLPALPVRVVSSLEDRLSTDLYDVADLDVGFFGGYELTMWLLAAAWLATPFVVLAIRFARRSPPPLEIEEAHEPTLAERLMPLCEAAAERELTVDEKARLELLLYQHWRDRFGLGGADLAEEVARLRRDGRSARIVHEIERWLHARDGDPVDPARLRGEVQATSRTPGTGGGTEGAAAS